MQNFIHEIISPKERTDNPQVSVIVANYNNSKYVVQCINSIMSQRHVFLEVLIVDDASTDDSVSKISALCSVHDNIRLITSPVNRGVAAARNVGVERAVGAYLTFLDADDFYVSIDAIGSLLKAARSAELGGDSVCAYSGYMTCNEDGSAGAKRAVDLSGSTYRRILCREGIIPRDILFHRSCLSSVGKFDENLPIFEDWDFKIKLAKTVSFHKASNLASAYRQRCDGLSSCSRLRILYRICGVFLSNSKDIDIGHRIWFLGKLLLNVIKKSFK